MLENVCRVSPQVEKYIKSGVPKRDYFDKTNNKRARYILERLRARYPEISVISKRPVTLKWIPKLRSESDHSDLADPPREDDTTNVLDSMNEESVRPKFETGTGDEKSKFSKSLGRCSERSESVATRYQYCCYICLKNDETKFETNSKTDYESHCIRKHYGKTAYPRKADLQVNGWKTQDKVWEV